MAGCEECQTEVVPGALWPWGSEGHAPPRFPYVDRHDLCATFPNDDDAAAAVATAVGGIVVLAPCDPWGDEPQRRHPAVYPWPATKENR